MIIKTKRNICKLVSLVTLTSFLMTSSAWAMPDGGLAIMPQLETPSFLQVEIPRDLASVEEVYEAPAKENPKLILNIQDIHGNYESQVQISKLLQYLYEKFGFKLLFAEGAAEKLNIDLLRFFPDAERNHKLADLMAKNGELTGIEYFMMDGPKDVEAVGIEKTELYRQNYEAFKKVYRSKSDVDAYLDLFDGRLETLSSRVFSANTRRLLSEWKKFESGHRDFLPYVKRLSADAKTVLNLDLESLFAQVEWPQITRLLALQSMEADLDRKAADKDRERLLVFLKEQKISEKIIHAVETLDEKKISMTRSEAEARREDLPRYLFERLVDEAGPKGFRFHDYPAFSLWAGHLILQNELDSKILFEEIEKVFTRILTELTVSEREKNLMELTRDEILLKKLFHLELTRKEWERAVYRKDWLVLSAMVGRLKKISDEISGDLKLNAEDWAQLDKISASTASDKKESLSKILETSYEFYDFARKRESVFFKTINDTMNEKKIEKAVLVTGGFHTDGLMDMFRENEFNASILMPRITGDLDNSNYISTMMENKPSMFDITTMQIVMRAQSLFVQGQMDGDENDVAAALVQYLINNFGMNEADATAMVGEHFNVTVATEHVAGEKTKLRVIRLGEELKAEMRTVTKTPAVPASTAAVSEDPQQKLLLAARTLAKSIYGEIQPKLGTTAAFRDVRQALEGIKTIAPTRESIEGVLANLEKLQTFRKEGNVTGLLEVSPEAGTVAGMIERLLPELYDLRRLSAALNKEALKADTVKRLTEVSDFRNNPVGEPPKEKINFRTVIDQLNKPADQLRLKDVLDPLEASLRPLIGSDFWGLNDDVLKDLVLRVLSLRPPAGFDPTLRLDRYDNNELRGFISKIRNEMRTVATYKGKPLVNVRWGADDDDELLTIIDYIRESGTVPAVAETLNAAQVQTATGTALININPSIKLYAGQNSALFAGMTFPDRFFTGDRKPSVRNKRGRDTVADNFRGQILEAAKVNFYHPMGLPIEPLDMGDMRLTVFTPDDDEIAIRIDLTPNYFNHTLGDLPVDDPASGIGGSGLTYALINDPRTAVQFIGHSESVGQWNIRSKDGRNWTVWSGDSNNTQARGFKIVIPASSGVPEQSFDFPIYNNGPDEQTRNLSRVLAERTLRGNKAPEDFFEFRARQINAVPDQERYQVNWKGKRTERMPLSVVMEAFEEKRKGSFRVISIDGAPFDESQGENQEIRNGSIIVVVRAEDREAIPPSREGKALMQETKFSFAGSTDRALLIPQVVEAINSILRKKDGSKVFIVTRYDSNTRGGGEVASAWNNGIVTIKDPEGNPNKRVEINLNNPKLLEVTIRSEDRSATTLDEKAAEEDGFYKNRVAVVYSDVKPEELRGLLPYAIESFKRISSVGNLPEFVMVDSPASVGIEQKLLNDFLLLSDRKVNLQGYAQLFDYVQSTLTRGKAEGPYDVLVYYGKKYGPSDDYAKFIRVIPSKMASSIAREALGISKAGERGTTFNGNDEEYREHVRRQLEMSPWMVHYGVTMQQVEVRIKERTEFRAVAAPVPAQAKVQAERINSAVVQVTRKDANGITVSIKGVSLIINTSGIQRLGMFEGVNEVAAALKRLGGGLSDEDLAPLSSLELSVDPKFALYVHKLIEELKSDRADQRKIAIPGLDKTRVAPSSSAATEETGFLSAGAAVLKFFLDLGEKAYQALSGGSRSVVSAVTGGIFLNPTAAELSRFNGELGTLKNSDGTGIRVAVNNNPEVNAYIESTEKAGAASVILDLPITDDQLTVSEGALDSLSVALEGGYSKADVYLILVQRDGRAPRNLSPKLTAALAAVAKEHGGTSRIHVKRTTYQDLPGVLLRVRGEVENKLSGNRIAGTQVNSSNYRELYVTTNASDDFRDAQSSASNQVLRLDLAAPDVSTPKKMNEYIFGGTWVTLLEALGLSQKDANMIQKDEDGRGTINKSLLGGLLKGLSTALAALRKLTASA